METVPSPLISTLAPLFWATLTASSNIIDNWDVGWDVDVVGEGTPTSEFVYIVGNPVYSLSITIKGLRGNQSRNWRLYCSLILFNRFSSLVSTSDTTHCSNPLNWTWSTFLIVTQRRPGLIAGNAGNAGNTGNAGNAGNHRFSSVLNFS